MRREDDKKMKIETKILSDIFDKKSKKSILKDLTHVNNDTGKTRHYTPAAQE